KGSDVTLPATSTTNASGEATITLTSTTKAVAGITVSAKVAATASVNANKTVNFVADSSTAKVSTVTLNGDTQSKVANGTNAFTYTVQVVDGNGNPVVGATVTPASDETNVKISVGGTTNASGQATITLTSTTKAVADITVNAKVGTTAAVDANKMVSFTADEGTATITEPNLTVVTNNQLANGVAKNQLKAVVTDANGNVVPNVDVVFTVTNGGLPGTQTLKTNASGEVLFEVTNTKAGVTSVKVSINGTEESKDVTFIADISTAIVNFVSVPNLGTFFIGTTYEISASLVDKYNNAITQSGIQVEWTIDNNDVILSANSSITSGDGKAKIRVNGYNQVENATIFAKVKASEQTPVSGNYKLSFLPEFKLEGADRGDVSASQLLNNFKTNNSILINNRDTKWFGRINLPDANLAVGKTLIIVQESNWASNLFFDGKKQRICKTNKYSLVSNGNKWSFTEAGNLPSSQCTLFPGQQNID
ncbi:Ig-like domain-containing protein, partial [Providencia alcalifaciens]|uniref:Ig-like domain-containing protein n=1 Tax=Providencia alcalifaciens TaxID=126385 RepID=UPI00029C188F